MTPSSSSDDYVPSAEAAELYPDNGDHRRSHDAFAAYDKPALFNVGDRVAVTTETGVDFGTVAGRNYPYPDKPERVNYTVAFLDRSRSSWPDSRVRAVAADEHACKIEDEPGLGFVLSCSLCGLLATNEHRSAVEVRGADHHVTAR